MRAWQNGKIQVDLREEVKGKKGRTSNWNIVITILKCDMVNIIRIHTVVVAVRLMLVLLCFLDTTVHLK